MSQHIHCYCPKRDSSKTFACTFCHYCQPVMSHNFEFWIVKLDFDYSSRCNNAVWLPYFSFYLFFSLIYTYDVEKQWANKAGKRKVSFFSQHLVERSTMPLHYVRIERGWDVYGCLVHTYFFWFERRERPILELPFCPAVPFIPICFGLFYSRSSFLTFLLRHMDLTILVIHLHLKGIKANRLMCLNDEKIEFIKY